MRIVRCRKYGEELEGLEAPPMPGPVGQAMFDSVSRKAWQEWQHLQTMLINEKHLNVRDPESRRYLSEQRERFFDNGDYDRPGGYVAPAAKPG